MAIVPLQRVTFLGELHRREEVLLRLQQLGGMHLSEPEIQDREAASPSVVNLVKDAHGDGSLTRSTTHHGDVQAALKYLQSCPDKRPPHGSDAGSEQIIQVIQEVLQLENSNRSLSAERETVAEKIEQTRPWGQFQFPTTEELGGQQLFLYRLTHRQADQIGNRPHRSGQGNESPASEIVASSTTSVVVNRDQRHEYRVVIADQAPDDMPCPPEELDPRPLDQLQQRLSEIDNELEQQQLRRIALTSWIPVLRDRSVAIEDEITRRRAAGKSFVDGPVFVLEGWAAEKELPRLQNFAEANAVTLCSRPPRVDEQPPTLLSNPRPVAGAEGAVTFFMTPNYRAWDPTWVMFVSFAAFFAMILADAGYGLVLAVILAFAIKPLGRTAAGRRFRQLAIFIVLITIVYGVLIGSYFGFSPPTGSLPDRLVIKSAGVSIVENREAMMLVSASIGVFHLVLANLVVAWRWIGSGHAFASVGWVATLIGGWLLALARIPKPDTMSLLSQRFGHSVEAWTNGTSTTGMWLLVVGLALVFLFSSTKAVFTASPKDWLMRLVDGFMGLTGVTKAFGDALSYLRLFALGLASAQLAIIFNQLAADASQVRGVGLLLGLLIFLLGHTLNLVLAVVGGVVHGLRLNCIEFFSWSLTDEGQPFEPFEMKANR